MTFTSCLLSFILLLSCPCAWAQQKTHTVVKGKGVVISGNQVVGKGVKLSTQKADTTTRKQHLEKAGKYGKIAGGSFATVQTLQGMKPQSIQKLLNAAGIFERTAYQRPSGVAKAAKMILTDKMNINMLRGVAAAAAVAGGYYLYKAYSTPDTAKVSK
jgi:hypothetical protein